MSNAGSKAGRRRHEHEPGTRKRQSTLLGFWDSENGDGRSGPAAARRRRRQHSSPTPPAAAATRRLCADGPRQGWKDVGVQPHGPMMILRGCLGGRRASERQAARKALASLPHWDDDATFRVGQRECRMRRRICQFSSGGALSYSYSGLVRRLTSSRCRFFPRVRGIDPRRPRRARTPSALHRTKETGRGSGIPANPSRH